MVEKLSFQCSITTFLFRPHGSQRTAAFFVFVFDRNTKATGKKHLKIAEVKYDVSISLLVSPVFQPEHSWNELRQPQHLGNDGIAAGNDPQDCLATEVILSQEVQHCDGDPLLHTTMVGMINGLSELGSVDHEGKPGP